MQGRGRDVVEIGCDREKRLLCAQAKHSGFFLNDSETLFATWKRKLCSDRALPGTLRAFHSERCLPARLNLLVPLGLYGIKTRRRKITWRIKLMKKFLKADTRSSSESCRDSKGKLEQRKPLETYTARSKVSIR